MLRIRTQPSCKKAEESWCDGFGCPGAGSLRCGAANEPRMQLWADSIGHAQNHWKCLCSFSSKFYGLPPALSVLCGARLLFPAQRVPASAARGEDPAFRKINTSDLLKAARDICIPTENIISAHKITKSTWCPCCRGQRVTNVCQTAKWHTSDWHHSQSWPFLHK